MWPTQRCGQFLSPIAIAVRMRRYGSLININPSVLLYTPSEQ